MDPQTLFDLAFPLAVPFWALMIFLPGWSVTRRIISSPWIAVPPLLVYLTLLIPQFAPFWAAVSSPNLGVLAALFGTPAGAAAAWAHFIGFDLFVGRWMYLDARERRTHPLVMAPLLVLTILLSPLGLMAYLLVRAVLGIRRPAPQPATV
ncbi:MAG: DUF4281 domain-containing protein [Pseudonocardia sp.]|nr:DUF4281 domain-containing protein [Pseudonocardia sp.]